jgi:hypothetical protein
MGAQVADTSVRTSIVIDAPIELAFRVFTEQFDRIKPREHNMLAVAIKETSAGTSMIAALTAANVAGRACWPSSHRTVSYSAGTSVHGGRSRPMPLRPARSRCASLPKLRSAPVSSWSTETSIAMAQVGRASATAWLPTKVGRSTCSASPSWSSAAADGVARRAECSLRRARFAAARLQPIEIGCYMRFMWQFCSS